MRKVMICTPAMDGRVHTGYMNAYVHTVLAAKEKGWKISSQMLVHNSNISHARALLCDNFMKSDAEVMFSIDSDLVWPVEGFFKVLDTNHDVVLGCYPKKQDKLEFTMFGAGFAKITRAAIEKMRKAYPDLAASYVQQDVKKDNLFMLWNEMIDHGLAVGEDIAFFRRWEMIGGEIRIETDIEFEHHGTKAYCGNLADELRKETGNGSLRHHEYVGHDASAN